MKIGILTLHSQLNYGGILQAYALQTFLQKSGYDVQILDRRFDHTDSALLRKYRRRFSLKYLLCAVLGTGHFQYWRRIEKTLLFFKEKLNLTEYHFVQWDEVDPRKIEFDFLISGSDQIWNPCNDLSVYLVDVPGIRVPLISYAASFGNFDFREQQLALLRKRLPLFRHISVREREGKDFLRRLKIASKQVMDPVFLLSSEDWKNMLSPPQSNEKKLVCYFMENYFERDLPDLERFAQKENCKIEIFVNSYLMNCGTTLSSIIRFFRRKSSMKRNHIEIKFGAGPLDFLESVRSAEWILTDSFHGTAFSTVFQKKIAVLFPEDPWRLSMFSRIRELCQTFYEGECIFPDIASALRVFSRNGCALLKKELLREKIRESVLWLFNAISDPASPPEKMTDTSEKE